MNSVMYLKLLMVLFSFELEVIQNKSSSIVGEFCELYVVRCIKRPNDFLYESFGKVAVNNKVCSIEPFSSQESAFPISFNTIFE